VSVNKPSPRFREGVLNLTSWGKSKDFTGNHNSKRKPPTVWRRKRERDPLSCEGKRARGDVLQGSFGGEIMPRFHRSALISKQMKSFKGRPYSPGGREGGGRGRLAQGHGFFEGKK